MNTNIKSKLFSSTIILLLLVNTAAIAFMLLNKNKKTKHPAPIEQQGNAFVFLVKELKLDSNQIQQYTTLLNAHRASADSIKIIKRQAKESLFSLLKTSNETDANVQLQLNNIAQLERSFDEITFAHFKKVRALCNTQQQAKFDEVIATAMKMQAPQHRPPPHDRRPPEDREQNGIPEDDNRPPHER